MMMTHKVFIYKSFFSRQNRNVIDSKLCVLKFRVLNFCALKFYEFIRIIA